MDLLFTVAVVHGVPFKGKVPIGIQGLPFALQLRQYLIADVIHISVAAVLRGIQHVRALAGDGEIIYEGDGAVFIPAFLHGGIRRI